MVADLSITRQTSVGDVRLTADFAGRHINVVGGLRRTEPCRLIRLAVSLRLEARQHSVGRCPMR